MKLLRLSTAMIAAVVLAMMALLLVGCGGNDAAPPTGPVPAVMIVLPGYVFQDGQTAIPTSTDGLHFQGPPGEYGFTVTTPMGSPTDQSGRRYYLSVEWVDEDGFIGDSLIPNSRGNYFLAARRYQVSARVDAPERPGLLVAQCWLEISASFPLPSQ